MGVGAVGAWGLGAGVNDTKARRRPADIKGVTGLLRDSLADPAGHSAGEYFKLLVRHSVDVGVII